MTPIGRVLPMAMMALMFLGGVPLGAVLAAPADVNVTTSVDTNTTNSDKNSGAEEDPDNLGLVQAALQRGCAARYTMTCLKLDALSVLGRLAVPASYDLLPGVTIHRQDAASAASAAGARRGLGLPPDLVRSLATDTPSQVDKTLDEYIMARFGSFLDSHTVQVHLLDLQPVASGVRRALTGAEASTGRRKNGMWQQLMGAGMMMGGSTLTMGLSALAAMAGKALMLSMLSLVLSALSGMSGGGGGGGGGHSQKQTTYEIISKPIYTHGHSHSAELHHEPSAPASYGLYGRAKDASEGALSAGASGVGGSALGGSPASYIAQFPRSLQESTAQISHHTKKAEEEKTAASAGNSIGAANYDSLLIRNLQYVKSQDGRAKYSVTSPTDLVPSETDYTASNGDDTTSGSTTSKKYTSHHHDDPSARSFKLSEEEAEEEEGYAGVSGLAGVYEAGAGAAGGSILAGPRSMHSFARLPHRLVGHQLHQQAAVDRAAAPALPSAPVPEEVLPLSSSASSWAAITSPPPLAGAAQQQQLVNPAFVVAKPVGLTAPSRMGDELPGSAAAATRTVAYHAYS